MGYLVIGSEFFDTWIPVISCSVGVARLDMTWKGNVPIMFCSSFKVSMVMGMVRT